MDTDGIHRFGREEGWEEAFHFGFHDSKNDLSGFMGVGLTPNLHKKNVFCLLLLPDGGAVGLRREVRFDSTELSAGGLVFQMIIPEERWKLMFNGTMPDMTGRGSRRRTSLLLDFEASSPVFDHRECGGSFHRMLSGGDFEQVEQLGTVSGTVEVADREFEVQAVGAKSHHWGVKDRENAEYTWVAALLEDGSGFDLSAVRTADGEVLSGFVQLEGEKLPLRDGLVVSHLGDSGEPLSLGIVMNHEKGSAETEGEVRKNAVVNLPGGGKRYHIVSRFTMGGETGFGVGEYLDRR
ncbi:MAG: hypothetical protein ACLFPN_06080 [Methanomassiliicoccales archaeon]